MVVPSKRTPTVSVWLEGFEERREKFLVPQLKTPSCFFTMAHRRCFHFDDSSAEQVKGWAVCAFRLHGWAQTNPVLSGKI